MNACPFCTLPPERILLNSAHGVIIRDGFPISPGHTLVIPRRHVDSFFNLTADERVDLLGLLDQAKAGIEKEFKPDTYNIGINDGPAAGQTVPHLHIHLIPDTPVTFLMPVVVSAGSSQTKLITGATGDSRVPACLPQ